MDIAKEKLEDNISQCSINTDASDIEHDSQRQLVVSTIFPRIRSKSVCTIASNKEKNPSKKLLRNRKDLFIFIALAVLSTIYSATISLLAPFFPDEAEKKGVGSAINGWIFAVYPLICFLLSPVAGAMVPVIGLKFSLLAGSFLEGGTQILFGFVGEMPNKTTFIVFSFLIRSITAIGSAFAETSALAIISIRFKENVTQMFSILEVFYGIGLMSGPAIGGLLYKVGGFRLPFFFTGGLNLLTLFLVYWVLPDEYEIDEEEERTVSLFNVLKVPSISLLCFVSMTGAMVVAFYEPILSVYLQGISNNGLSSVTIGLVFLIASGAYTIFSPVVGYFIKTDIQSWTSIIIGSFLTSVGYVFLGPPSFTSIQPSILVVCLSLLVIGGSNSLLLIPVFGEMQATAVKVGLPDNLSTSSLLSGLFNGFYSIGCVAGPALAGLLVDATSFSFSTMVMAALLFLQFLVLASSIVCKHVIRRNKRWRKHEVLLEEAHHTY